MVLDIRLAVSPIQTHDILNEMIPNPGLEIERILVPTYRRLVKASQSN